MTTAAVTAAAWKPAVQWNQSSYAPVRVMLPSGSTTVSERTLSRIVP